MHEGDRRLFRRGELGLVGSQVDDVPDGVAAVAEDDFDVEHGDVPQQSQQFAQFLKNKFDLVNIGVGVQELPQLLLLVGGQYDLADEPQNMVGEPVLASLLDLGQVVVQVLRQTEQEGLRTEQ